MASPKEEDGTPEQLAISRQHLSRVLDIPMRTLSRLESAGQIPGRFFLGEKLVRYDVRVLKRWQAAGFPPVERWDGEA